MESNGRRTKSNADTLRKAQQPTLSATSAASGLGTTSKSLASHAEILRGIDEGGKNTQPQAMIISRTTPSEDGCGRGCISQTMSVRGTGMPTSTGGTGVTARRAATSAILHRSQRSGPKIGEAKRSILDSAAI